MPLRQSHPLRRALAAVAVPALVAGVLVLGAAPASAAESDGDARPDRVVLTPPQNPSTSQSFTWRTGADVVDGAVHIRPAGSVGEWRVVDAYANDPLADGELSVRTHSATVTGLEPGTQYEYYVGNGDASSETWTFRTAGTPGDEFTFIYFGDAQNELGDKWRPTVEAAYEKYPDAVGTVNAGDLINHSNSAEWTQWFDGMAGYAQTSNVIAAPGNHEYSDDSFLRHWKSNFEYPANGPEWAGDEGASDAERQEAAYRAHMAEVIAETAYFTDYQGVRFISLNASRSQAARLFTPDDLPPCLIGCPDPTALWIDMQAEWLDEILADNPNKWAVATFHQPVFSTAVGRDEADLRAAWLPVFQRNDIDLVLMGHDHTYARGYVNDDATATDGLTTGPVYAVSVAGPKYYDQQPEDDNVWTRNGATQVKRAGGTSTYQGITVSGDTIRYESYVSAKWDGEDASTTDVPVGGLLDAFTITKYDDGTKYVTEDGVEIPGPGDEPEPQDPDTPGEEPAQDPDEVALGHEVIGSIAASAATRPGASDFDPVNRILYVGDESPDGTGIVEAIDADSGESLRSFEVGAPISDLTYSSAEGGLLVISFGDAESGHRVNGFSTSEPSFGRRALDDDIVMPSEIRSVGLDASGDGTVYVALAAGAIIVIDIGVGDVVGQHGVGPAVRDMKVDPATGNLYVVFDSGDTGELRIYAGRSGMAQIRDYPLDGGAQSVALDPAAGLAYVGHSTGVSAVDIIAGTVLREADEAFGTSVRSVSADPDRGVVYVTSASRDPEAVVVAGRHQAPRILTSPAPQTVDAGERVTLEASAWAVPAADVTWEMRIGTGAWTAVAGADEPVLEFAAEQTGQYRAVFSNTIAGTEHTTASGTATVTVRADEDPNDPGDPGEPGDPGDPGEPNEPGEPTDPGDAGPRIPSLDDLTAENAGGLGAPAVLTPGEGVDLTIARGVEGQRVHAWLFSTPTAVGSAVLPATLALGVEIPAGIELGAHLLVVADDEGNVLGWQRVTVSVGDDGSLAVTGADVAGGVIAAATLVLVGLALLLVVARRRQTEAAVLRD